MSNRLYIVATSGQAKETAQVAHAICRITPIWDEIVYITQDKAEIGRKLPFGVVIGTDEHLFAATEPIDVAIGIGVPSARRRLAYSLRQYPNLRFPNLIHPSAVFDPDLVSLGDGNMIAAGCVLTCDIAVGEFNLFNMNVTVGHDARIGSYNVLNPGCNLSGNIHIENECLVGTGSQVLQKLRLASGCKLGAGAVLTKSCDVEGTVLTGVPARPRA